MPNQYDLLWPENVKQVMGAYILLWPIPFYNPEMKGWGFYYPYIPVLDQQTVGCFQLDAKLSKKDFEY